MKDAVNDNARIARWTAAVAQERARTAPPLDFPPLPSIPAGRYIDPEFFALERDALWRRNWLYAGHTDQLPAAGSYFVWDMAVRQSSSCAVTMARSEVFTTPAGIAARPWFERQQGEPARL